MLSTALNYLSERRKRFHRSDTAPNLDEAERLHRMRLNESSNDIEYVFLNNDKTENGSARTEDKRSRKSRSRRNWRSKSPVTRMEDEQFANGLKLSQTPSYEFDKSTASLKYDVNLIDPSCYNTLESLKGMSSGSESILSKSIILNTAAPQNVKFVESRNRLNFSDSDKELSQKSKATDKEQSPQDQCMTPKSKSRAARMREKVVAKASRSRHQNSSSSTIRNRSSRKNYFSDQEEEQDDVRETRHENAKINGKISRTKSMKNSHRRAKSVDDKSRRGAKKKLAFEDQDENIATIVNPNNHSIDTKLKMEQLGTLFKPLPYSLNDESAKVLYCMHQGISPQEFLEFLNQRVENTADLHARLKVISRPSTSKYGIFGKSLTRQSSSNHKLSEPSIETDYERYCKSQIINEIFVAIERADFQGLLRTLTKFQGINVSDVVNEVNLSPIDLASLLLLPVEYIASLFLSGFKLGPVMNEIFNNEPCKYDAFNGNTHKHNLGSHLEEKLKEADRMLEESKVILEYSLADANTVGEGVNKEDYDDSMAKKMKAAFTKVSRCEREVQLRQNYKEYINELLDFYKKLENNCPSPASVRIMVKGNGKIILKIKPPKQQIISKSALSSNSDVESNSSDDNLANVSSAAILGYRVEWSTNPLFANDIHAFLCEPLLDPLSILCDSQFNGEFYKAAFYEIQDILPEDKPIYFRTYALSLVGWSAPVLSKPNSITPLDLTRCNGLNDNLEKYNTLLQDGNEDVRLGRYIGDDLKDELKKISSSIQREITTFSKGYNSDPTLNISSSEATASAMESSNLQQCVQSSKDIVSSSPQSSDNAQDSINQKQKSPKQQRRRSFRSFFGTSNNKFVKHMKNGVYLGVLCYTKTVDYKSQDQQYFVTLIEDCLPMVKITNDDPPLSSLKNEIMWLSKLACYSNQSIELKTLKRTTNQGQMPSSLQIKVNLLEALEHIRFSLGCSSVGKIYPEIIRSASTNIDTQVLNNHAEMEDDGPTAAELSSLSCPSIILIVKRVPDISDVVLTSGLRWNPMKKILRKHCSKPEDVLQYIKCLDSYNEAMNPVLPVNTFEITQSNPESEVVSKVIELLQFHQRELNSTPLAKGLFLIYLQMQAHIDQSGTVITWNDKKWGSIMPFQKIRNRSYVSRNEWSSLRKQSPDLQTNLAAAKDLDCDGDNIMRGLSLKFLNSIYKSWDKLSKRLKLPSEFSSHCRIYLTEVIQLNDNCSAIVITPPIDQVCLPPGSHNEIPENCHWTSLNLMETQLASMYDSQYFRSSANLSASLEILLPILNHAKRQTIIDKEIAQLKLSIENMKCHQTKLETYWKFKRWISDTLSAMRDKSRVFATSIPIYLTDLDRIMKEKNFMSDWTGMYDSGESEAQLKRLLSPPPIDAPSLNTVGEVNTNQMTSLPPAVNILSGTLRIYAGYKTGIADGTSIRLLVSANTNSQEIIRLVVRQLAKTVAKYCSNGKAHPPVDDIDSTYCLTISVGKMERILPSSFHPLLLQAPWRSGKLFIRLKSETTEQRSFNSLIITRTPATKMYRAQLTPKPTIHFHNP